MLALQIFNAIEAVFWLLLAGVTATQGHKTRGFTPRRQMALAIFLAAFGLSDIIEVFTGAWWQPPALLVLKAVCLTGLVITAALVCRDRWRGSAEAASEGQ